MHTYIRTYIRNFKLLDFSRRWVQVGGGTSSFCSYFEGWSPVGPCDGWKFKFLCFFSRLVPNRGGTSSFEMFLEGWSLSELELRVF